MRRRTAHLRKSVDSKPTCYIPAAMEVNRRTFLQSAVSASVAIALHSSLPSPLLADERRTFFPVKVSRDRLIRTVVGLRPYRPGGFLVDAERLGEKLLIHNYGHDRQQTCDDCCDRHHLGSQT